MIFARKMLQFYIIIAGKYFFKYFFLIFALPFNVFYAYDPTSLLVHLVLVLVRDALQKPKADVRRATKLSNFVAQLCCASDIGLRLNRFKSDRDEIWQDCFSSKYALIFGVGFLMWRDTFKICTYITSCMPCWPTYVYSIAYIANVNCEL